MKEHEALSPLAAVAVHVTVVAPTGNIVPVAGSQLTVTGATPPDAAVMVNETATGDPFPELAVTSAGQVRRGADDGLPDDGGVGEVGVDESLHIAAAATTMTAAAKRRARRKAVEILLEEVWSAAMSQPSILQKSNRRKETGFRFRSQDQGKPKPGFFT
jgi:hypothetical protein